MMYGIYNSMNKQFCYGIKAPTEKAARKALFKKIGKRAYKWRYKVRPLPKEIDYEH